MLQILLPPVFAKRHWDALRMRSLASRRHVGKPASARLCRASERRSAHACLGYSAAMLQNSFLPVFAKRPRDSVRVRALYTGRHVGKTHFRQSLRSVVGLHFACVPWLLGRHVAKSTSARLCVAS